MFSEEVLAVDRVGLFRKAGRIAHAERRELASANIDHSPAIKHTLRWLHETLRLVRVLERVLAALLDSKNVRIRRACVLVWRARVVKNRPHFRIRNRTQSSRAHFFPNLVRSGLQLAMRTKLNEMKNNKNTQRKKKS
jgi:hypothetical protein